ncbi:MAG TPA: TonB-dependent receptor [Bryobacteraceae bacterium]
MKQLRRSLFVFACLLVAAVCVSTSAYSQVLYGTLVGTVTDQSDAVVPKADVTATNGATNQTYRAVTDDQGRYSIPDVLPGKYTIKVSATGFRSLVQNEVNVSINTVNRADLKLQVGQVSEQITVEGQAVALQTDKSDVHSEISSTAIENMPLSRYRNYQQLINLVPGATPAAFQNSSTDTPGKAMTTNVNGANRNSNNTRLDGAMNVNVWLPHHVAYVAPADTIETVNIATDAFDAEQGMAGGAAVTVITKSGTNDLHGSAYTYYDNQHLKTRNFFQAPGTEKPFGTNLISGGTIGGPIIKNKLFFFGGWERTEERGGAVVTTTLPTADQRLGNFSAYKTTIYDPTTGDKDAAGNFTGANRTAFQNNIIPSSRITPQALAVQNLLPATNLGSGATNNYFISGTPNLVRNQYDMKVNYQMTDKLMVWGKYSIMDANVVGQPSLGAAVGAGIGGDAGVGHTFQQLATIGSTWVLSPNMVLDANVGYTRMSQYVLGSDYGKNYGTDVFKIPGTNGSDISQSGMPSFIFNTYATIGNVNTWMPLFRTDESYTNSDNLTWTHGAHEFRFGFDMVRYHLNHFQPELGGGPRGQFTFNGGTTGTVGYSPNQFNSYAAFLLGSPDDVQKSYQYILMTGREWQFGWYARDRWQVNRNLTVNIGLRYEFYPLMTRCCGKGLERYDPSTNLLYLGGRGNVPVDDGFTVSKKLFAPRVGFAYRLGENTVIRSGYGISYDPIPYSRPLRGFYPLTINYQYVGANNRLPGTTLAAGIPAPDLPDLSTGIIPLPGKVTERSPWGGEIKRGYIQSWNFTIERKLPGNILGSIAYVGTQTTHQLADFDINSGVPGSTNANLPLAKYGRTAALDMWGGYLSSHYHSLQTSVNKQLAHGLLVKGAYTWSKAIDYTDDDGWAAPSRMYGFQWNRAPAGYDRTHVFQVGWVYEVPVGKGKTFVNSGPAAYILGNWKLNGALSAFTGTPFTVTASGTSVDAGPENQQSADQVKTNVQRLGGVGPGQPFYDPTAFAPVTAVRFGTSGRNILRGPGVFNTDLSLFREFPIKERLKLEFRTDCFNITNTPKFPTPSGNTANASAGTFMITTSTLSNNSTAISLERQFRFGLRLVF